MGYFTSHSFFDTYNKLDKMKSGEIMTLNELSTGESAIVSKIDVDDDMTRRLLDIGLVEGTKVKSLYRSYMKDPTAYSIRGAVIALRNSDAKKIHVMRGYHEDIL